MDFQTLFALAMKRALPGIIPFAGLTLNLGAGLAPVPRTTPLDLPEWNAETDPIPYGDGAVDHILAFHFFEHLSGKHALAVLRECERVLRPSGVLTLVVPLAPRTLAFQDLDHKSFWNEETLRTLFRSAEYYEKHGAWNFRLHLTLIAGIVERNLAVFHQLVKE